ncbi:MAG: cyanophycinase [Flavisolibacter sp.]|jgi:cyanophycinase
MKSKSSRQRSSSTNKENHCPVPSSTLLIIGGKENKGQAEPENKKKPKDFIRLEVLETFRKLIDKRDPVIEVITTSSGEPTESFNDYRKVFTELGIEKIGHIHHNSRKEAIDDDLADRLKKADAFFFSGGDQLKITSIYGGTPFLYELKERYIHDTILIAGTSAGAMAMSTPMIYAGNEEVQELGGQIKIAIGLEFLKDVCIDTHFVHRGRFVRMAQVLATNPTCVGIGIEEDTAIIVRNGQQVEVVGTGLVIIIEGFNVTETNIEDFTEDKPVTIKNLSMHLLSSGNKYEIQQVNPPHK